MRETVERELKLRPGPGFVMPELGGELLPERTFVSTYHDSDDLRLGRRGVTLRHRVEAGTGLWQLKLPHGAARLELEVAGPPWQAPAELAELLTAYLRGRSLVPVARLRTRRRVVRAQGAEIVDDEVAVLEGQRIVRRFRELEVELLEGGEGDLRRLEQELRRAGADGSGELRPKLHQALDLPAPEQTGPIPAGTPATEAIGLAFQEQYEQLLAHDPGSRRGDDPESLHQLRVATRRLRAFLRSARPLLDRSFAEELRAELGWLGGALGPARDLDVMLERLRAEVALLEEEAPAARGLLDELEAERTGAYEAVREALSSARYLELLDRLEAAASPPLSGKRTTLARIWEREVERLRATFSDLGNEPADDALHASRIGVKRARYAAELAAHELAQPGEAFVSRAKKLQDILGDHQDAVVAAERIEAWSARAPKGRAAADRLIELERARQMSARAGWPEAWERLERAARKVSP